MSISIRRGLCRPRCTDVPTFSVSSESGFSKKLDQCRPLSRLTQLGDFFTGRLLGDSYCVVMSENGPRAFHNVCRHHGTILLDDKDKTLKDKCIRCPYHGWTYNLNGHLIKATRLKGIKDFKPTDYGLKPIPMTTLGDLVFLDFGSTGPLPSLPDVGISFANLRHVLSRSYDVACNWKIYNENYQDGGMHIPYAHKDLDTSLDMKDYTIEVFDRHNVQSCNGIDPTRIGTRARYVWLYPNLMLNRYGKWLDTNRVVPTGPETCRVEFDYYLEMDTEFDDAKKQELEVSHKIQLEDEELCRRVQQGMHSSGYGLDYGKRMNRFYL